MATLDELREQRADAILSYYNNLMTYNSETDADGTDIEASKPQAKFKAFNDLIKLHHESLQDLFGYASHSSAYLSSDEGTIGTGEWWLNAIVTNTRASMFYIDTLVYSTYYHLNTTAIVNQRSPYILWNQYNSELGSINDFGWMNAASDFTYTNTNNPFTGTSNYRMKEPIEYIGDSTNLLWGRVVFDGQYNYKNQYIGYTGYTTHTDAGFLDQFGEAAGGSSIHYKASATANTPSPFEIMRHTFWGSGTEGSGAASNPYTVYSHTSGASGTFKIAGNVTGDFSINTWYIIYGSSSSDGWIFYLTNASYDIGPPSETTFTYTDANWPIPGSGVFDGSDRNFFPNPVIIGTTGVNNVKDGTVTNGRRNVWAAVYNQYYNSGTNSFKSAVDGISSQVETFMTTLDNITAFDYTIVNAVMDPDDPGKSDTSTVKTNFNTWLTDGTSGWKTLIGDTGSGATYTPNDSKWSDTNLDSLLTGSTGSLDVLISFSGSYAGTQSGYISSRRSQVYTLLGTYVPGTDEGFYPPSYPSLSINNIGENNSGYLSSNSFYYWRHNFANDRLNRDDGHLTIAYSSYLIYNDKYNDVIPTLETQMSGLVSDHEYDMTPIGSTTTLDNLDNIELAWDDVKAAASYTIERKDGSSGSWAVVQSTYGYTDPGSPPDFTPTPPASYADSAYTLGYQEFGLSFSSEDDDAGLASDFTIYDFNIAVDGGSPQTVELRGLDCETYEALRVAIQNEFNDLDILATSSIETDDIRITSQKRGAGSAIALTAGTTNDLFTALSTTLDSAVAGTSSLEQGKVYYYRLKVQNGRDYTLSGGTPLSKDWDSKSDYQYAEYLNDQATHGDAGAIVWDLPTNVIASGVDEDGPTPSNLHVRIEWDAVINADSYNIYRASTNDGGYAYIGNTSNDYYEDTTAIPGYIYYYKVQAVADTIYQLYDDTGTFDGPLVTDLPEDGVAGKRLWVAITLTATTDDKDKVTLTWNIMSGASGYVIYNSLVEDAPFFYIPNDDGSEMIVTGNSYVHAISARQYFANSYPSISDGVLSGDYTASLRYYFIVVASNVDGSATVKQYYITAPASGTWAISTIATSIQTAIDAELANVTCETVALENIEEDTVYKIRLITDSVAEKASISVIDGTFGESLLPLLGGMDAPEPGIGAYPGITNYYQVEAVQIVAGDVVRRSEKSNIAEGLRPIT